MQPTLRKAGFAAMILLAGTAMAGAQPARSAATEFTTQQRDALRQTWRADPAIRDFVGPGDEERLDVSSDFYSEDYTARQSLAPQPPASGNLAIATSGEPGR
ncbi:MAG: hypothetical protein V4653_21140 [Pseudomonadota bacterium]